MKTRTHLQAWLYAAAVCCLSFPGDIGAQQPRLQPDKIPPVVPDKFKASVLVDGAPTPTISEAQLEQNAVTYYTKSLDDLGIPVPAAGAKEITVKNLLTFMGYDSFDPKDAIMLPNAGLVALGGTGGDILSTAYFSPKISDVSTDALGIRRPFSYGWRKIIRFKAKGGSPAKGKGISTMHLLINVFTEDVATPAVGDPFVTQPNKQNQVILARDQGGSASQPMYWFVVDEIDRQTGAGGKLATFLNATFDARDPAIATGVQKYFVPDACVQCHGGSISAGKLNFVDTDHMYDRVQPGEDFYALRSFLTKINQSTLLDAGRIAADGGGQVSTPALQAAMRNLNIINGEIAAQNRLTAPPGTPPEEAFALRAVEKWLSLHAETQANFELPKDLFERAFDRVNNGRKWNASNPVDRQLLPILNRYCYRCHSTLVWNIMDKDYVFDSARGIIRRTTPTLIPPTNPQDPPVVKPASMPQDRRLGADSITSLHGLLEELRKQPPGQ